MRDGFGVVRQVQACAEAHFERATEPHADRSRATLDCFELLHRRVVATRQMVKMLFGNVRHEVCPCPLFWERFVLGTLTAPTKEPFL